MKEERGKRLAVKLGAVAMAFVMSFFGSSFAIAESGVDAVGHVCSYGCCGDERIFEMPYITICEEGYLVFDGESFPIIYIEDTMYIFVYDDEYGHYLFPITDDVLKMIEPLIICLAKHWSSDFVYIDRGARLFLNSFSTWCSMGMYNVYRRCINCNALQRVASTGIPGSEACHNTIETVSSVINFSNNPRFWCMEMITTTRTTCTNRGSGIYAVQCRAVAMHVERAEEQHMWSGRRCMRCDIADWYR